MRIFTGAPTSEFYTKSTTDLEMWSTLSDAKESDYLVTLSTDSSEGTLNICGIERGHAFTVLRTFRLASNGQSWKMYMIRNPRGYS